MAIISTNSSSARIKLTNNQLAMCMLLFSVFVTILQWSDVLPTAIQATSRMDTAICQLMDASF